MKRNEIEMLARYNAERVRGLVHTAEWRAEMATLQRQFNEYQRAKRIAESMTEHGDGLWMTSTRRRPWRERLRNGKWWQGWTS